MYIEINVYMTAEASIVPRVDERGEHGVPEGYLYAVPRRSNGRHSSRALQPTQVNSQSFIKKNGLSPLCSPMPRGF